MGSAQKGLTPREAVLLAIDAADGVVEGRTAMQKITYFIALALNTDLGHQAHYYGPYSRKIEYALAQTALAEEVTEVMERFPSYTPGPDIRKYTYELTEAGRASVHETVEAHSSAATRIKQTVDAVHEAVPDLDQRTLSMAAKIHFIISEQEEPTQLVDIPDLAKELGWRISDTQVSKSVDLLRGLNLVT